MPSRCADQWHDYERETHTANSIPLRHLDISLRKHLAYKPPRAPDPDHGYGSPALLQDDSEVTELLRLGKL